MKKIYLIALIILMVVLTAYINPIAYNNAVGMVGLNGAKRDEPFIEVDHCRMYDGDTVTFMNGEWTTSRGCQSVSIKNPDYDAYTLTYVNLSHYRFELIGATVQTPLNMFQDEATRCIWIYGISTPRGIRLKPGCASILFINQPVTYQLNFLPSIPHDPGYMREAIGRMNDLLDPVLPCYDSVARDEYSVVVIQDGLPSTVSGNVPKNKNFTFNLPEAGKYYLGISVGEDLSSSIFHLPMIPLESCSTTRWWEATAKPDTMIKIENP